MERPERRFWLRLSRRYGKPLNELQQEIDSQHFSELHAFERLEPPLEVLVQLYLAQIAYILACANAKKGTRPKFDDFIFKFEPKRQVDPKELKRKFMGWAKMYNKAGGK